MRKKNLLQPLLLLHFFMLSFQANYAQVNVKIGRQFWMRMNLNVDTFRNGDKIPQVKSIKEWQNFLKVEEPAWCYYENKQANGQKYGKLYNFYAVTDSRGLAPQGYHIPSEEEWMTLINFLGGKDKAAIKMKSNSGWKDEDNGTNSSGFSAKPAGVCEWDIEKGTCNGEGEMTLFWSTTTKDEEFVVVVYIAEDEIDVDEEEATMGLSVRCIKD